MLSGQQSFSESRHVLQSLCTASAAGPAVEGDGSV